MSRYRVPFHVWYEDVLAVGRSWSLDPRDIDKIDHSWFRRCWELGWRPDDALIAALEDTGAMDSQGRVTGW